MASGGDAKMVGGREASDTAEASNQRAASYAVDSLNSGHELRKNFVGAEGALTLVSIKKASPFYHKEGAMPGIDVRVSIVAIRCHACGREIDIIALAC